MTKREKRDLAYMVRRGLTEEQIVRCTVAKRSTVKKYIKAIRSNKVLSNDAH